MLRDRFDPAAAPLAAGDLAVLAAVFAAGTVRHNGPGVLVTDTPYVLATVGPFLLGWAVAGPLLGAYGPGVLEGPVEAVGRGVGAWLGADALAVGLRATPLLHGGASPVFVLVTLVFGGGGLALWRGVYALAVGRSR